MRSLREGIYEYAFGIEMHTSRYGMGGNARRMAKDAYKRNRLNGDKCDTPKEALPEDGSVTWVSGDVKDDVVYGIKESDGKYRSVKTGYEFYCLQPFNFLFMLLL